MTPDSTTSSAVTRALVADLLRDRQALNAPAAAVAADPAHGSLSTDGATLSPYVTPNEAARLLRCHVRRIYTMASDGRLRRFHEGHRLLVDRAEVLGQMQGPE